MLLQDPLKLLSIIGTNLPAGIAGRLDAAAGLARVVARKTVPLTAGVAGRNSSGHKAILRNAGEIHTRPAMAAAYF